MTFWLEQRPGGHVALVIDGDVQFDTRDERVYHEALVLPALALAEARTDGLLRVLVCGGGDGLAARELLKSPRVGQVDLADYDGKLVEYARSRFEDLNEGSLRDPRVRVTIADARAFVRDVTERYDLIVCDLTVPRDAAGCELQSVGWYESLAGVLAPRGVLAANAASPSGAPHAFAAMVNSVRVAALWAAPLRVPIGSFEDAGYGPDWGFVLGTREPVTTAEILALQLAGTTQVLRAGEALGRLFMFPDALRAIVDATAPVRAGGAELLALFGRPGLGDEAWPATWNTFGRPLGPLTGAALEPESPGVALDAALALERARSLLPGVPVRRAEEMLEVFCAEPGRFLDGIDLRGVVSKLLARARELPRAFVTELRDLRRRLRRFGSDREAVLQLGSKVLAIVAVVVILANLALPETAYGKGSAAGSAPGASVTTMAHPSTANSVPLDQPSVASTSGFRSYFAGGGRSTTSTIDETGTLFPSRRYHYWLWYDSNRGGYTHYQGTTKPSEPAVIVSSIYRLTPDTDVLSDGRITVSIGDGSSYLLVGKEVSVLTNRDSGEPILYVQSDPGQVWRIAKELDRQVKGLDMTAASKQRWSDWFDWLDFLPGVSNDKDELKNIAELRGRLAEARKSLGDVPDQAPAVKPPVEGAFELFSSVWLAKDGSYVVALLPEGPAYVDGAAWYSDAARKTRRAEAYPAAFKAMLANFLKGQVDGEGASSSALANEQTLAAAELAGLQADLALYDVAGADPNEQVDYGTSKVSRAEAIRLTKEAIDREQKLIEATKAQAALIPAEAVAIRNGLAVFSK